MKIQELIDTTLSKLPKSEMPNDEFDAGYQITTSTKPMKIGNDKNINSCVAEKNELEEAHCRQILSLIELHNNMQCYIRIMPEKSEDGQHICWYTRLQFKKYINSED